MHTRAASGVLTVGHSPLPARTTEPLTLRLMTFRFLLLLSAFSLAALPATAQRTIVEDFERYRPGQVPERWHRIEGRGTVPLTQAFGGENEYFRAVRIDGRKALEAFTRGQSHSMVLPNGHGYAWRLGEQPRLSWAWKAEHLPRGAREDAKAKNDTGAALYVVFDADVLGRPRSIKYTYSSTLPVGTVVSFGSRMKAIVVSSGADGVGRWQRVERDVTADFQQVFGGTPPDRPLSLMIWSDSDTTGDFAKVYLDDIAISR